MACHLVTKKRGHNPGLIRGACLVVLAGIVFVVSACSSETVKRTTYETLQNIAEIKCQEDLSADCSGREPYEDYKRRMEDNEVDE